MAQNDFLIFPERGSHFGLFKHRNWQAVKDYWHSITKSGVIPCWISNPDHGYGVTHLQPLHDCGHDEYELYGRTITRKTYVVRIGYAGSHYQGYQSQGNKLTSILTVEDDIREALGRNSMAAGRTDKGVSALSQIISFYIHKEDISPEEILQKMRSHPSVQEGRLAIFDCQTVPRKFHALFSATWRRYMYLYPLNTPQQARDLEERKIKQNQSNNLKSDEDDEDDNDTDKHNDCYSLEDILYYPIGGPLQGDFSVAEGELRHQQIDIDIPYLNEMLSRIVNRTLHFNGFAYKEVRGTDESRGDECILYVARAFLVDITTTPSNSPQYAVCIELVGNRFLRRMVRILVATLLRECQIPLSQRQTNILEKICETGLRDRAAFPAPSVGLCMTGVGYDLEDLAKSKFTASNPKTIERNKRRREEKNVEQESFPQIAASSTSQSLQENSPESVAN